MLRIVRVSRARPGRRAGTYCANCDLLLKRHLFQERIDALLYRRIDQR
jgi:hypothetical protein